MSKIMDAEHGMNIHTEIHELYPLELRELWVRIMADRIIRQDFIRLLCYMETAESDYVKMRYNQRRQQEANTIAKENLENKYL